MRENTIPDGTRDITNEECIIKQRIIKNINKIFDSWGYKEVITPTIEFYETFKYDNSGLKEENMYKFFDNKGRILVLRPDMTVPVARVVATKLKDTKGISRLRYQANVFRVYEELAGMRNEYTDCGIELFSKEKNFSDLETLIIAIETLTSIGVKDFKLEIGDVNFFKSALEQLNISQEDSLSLAELVEKKRLKSLSDFLNNLSIDYDKKKFFMELPLIFGSGKELLDKYEEISFTSKMKASVKYLKSLYGKLEKLGYESCVSFDLGIIPRLNYYTGIIFRGFIQGSGNFVLSGGRYDELMKDFGQDLKAIGFSINIDELIQLMDISKYYKEGYKILFNEAKEIEALNKSIELRKKGYIVEIIPSKKVDDIKILKEKYYYGD
ncbi:ATP phosphoribosyltransferase regulatory subunit [Clostridium isatidis]|uniref:ATP phosphoribosyltransferase regulatory subunit n=1 Tax=Clostridium isatidis TaxID=182773 RepID=A0A343JE39_9CLOT|nr:ATP phosphoribosyltransferase regulatory subunit [Clostridium isatidis]ASW43797.1 ATP phosphoribosyltransferase regulatory subunit [Clostridium isatidis]NLL31633.1 ATP phosphoribosyltransferase regulatory subunit [Clostridiales bacterium]NLZ35200.1 ATP phosphoribosyltransferase regulatory subunit [Clostridiales bacterium]